jgi:hypothetical protein
VWSYPGSALRVAVLLKATQLALVLRIRRLAQVYPSEYHGTWGINIALRAAVEV